MVPVPDMHHPGSQENIVDSFVDHDAVISYLLPMKAFQGIVNMIPDVCHTCYLLCTAHTSLDSSICQTSLVCTVMGCQGRFQVYVWVLEDI